MSDCACLMFQQKGTCFHTGYRRPLPEPRRLVEITAAEEARRAFLQLCRERGIGDD